MGKYNFHDHPFKDEMLKMFDDGKNPYNVEDFLKVKGDEFLLSRPTLYKHYNNFKRATQISNQSKAETEAQAFKGKIETELWNTIEHCNKAMKDKSLSPKDWQYFDQQKQSAIEKLMRIKDFKGDAADASMILSKFFQKFTIDKALAEGDVAEKETQEETTEEINGSSEENNNGQGESSDILPGELV